MVRVRVRQDEQIEVPDSRTVQAILGSCFLLPDVDHDPPARRRGEHGGRPLPDVTDARHLRASRPEERENGQREDEKQRDEGPRAKQQHGKACRDQPEHDRAGRPGGPREHGTRKARHEQRSPGDPSRGELRDVGECQCDSGKDGRCQDAREPGERCRRDSGGCHQVCENAEEAHLR